MQSKMENTVAFDTNRAKQAFDRVLPEIEAVAPQEVAHVFVNVQDAAIVALRVAALMESPLVQADFAPLPERLFDRRRAQRLEDYAWAAWRTREGVMGAAARFDRAKLPPQLVDEAVALRDHLLSVTQYHLRGNPELDNIRRGSGYVDLASDLSRLAQLCEQHLHLLRQDTRFFKIDDVGRANRLLEAIVQTLRDGGDDSHRKWVDLQARAFTLLRNTYDAIRAAAGFVYHGNEAMLAQFPSLIAASRKTTRRNGDEAGSPKAAPGAEPAPSGDADAAA